MKKLYIPLILLIFLSFVVKTTAQVGIGTTTFKNGAIFQVESTNKGVLIPQVALISRNLGLPIIGVPATGLLVYNTAIAGIFPNNVSPGYYYWDGTEWRSIGDSKISKTVKYSNNSTTLNFNSSPLGVNVDIFNLLRWNEDNTLYQKVNNTDLRILESGYYEITCNLALNATDIEQYLELRLRLNLLDVGDKIFALGPEDSGNGGDFSVNFTQVIQINANDILRLRSYRVADNENVFFESLGTSSIVIKKIR